MVDRHLRLTVWVVGFVGCCLGNLSLAHAQTSTDSARRPNIVMAFADDWGRYASAYRGIDTSGICDVIETPHFDSIAKQGVLFTRAHVSAPSCTPCRSSLLSGQHFWRCGRGAILLGAIWDPSIASYPLELEKSGYRIGHTYKVWSPGTPADAPHGGAERSFNSAGRKFNGFSQYVSGKDDIEQAKQDLFEEVRMNVRSFLDPDGDGKSDSSAPFCYWLGPTNTHRTWIAGSGKKLWGIEPELLKGKLPKYLPDVPVVREDFADYLGEAQAFDASIGVLVEELKRIGEFENTIFVVSGDHGIPGVTRGKCNLYDLGTQVPLAICWPAGMKHVGRVVDDFVSLPDLAPTFMEAAGVEKPESMIAKSLMNVLLSDKEGKVDPSRDAVFIGRERHVATVREENRPYPQRAIRTDKYLYIINFEPDRWPMGFGPGLGKPEEPEPSVDELTRNTFAAFGDMDASPTKAFVFSNRKEFPDEFQYAFGLRPRVELYNVLTDADCLSNLAGITEYADVEQELHERLMNELQSTGDPRVSDDIVFERSPFTDANNPPRGKKKAK